uniref:Uncharacterized protein n=1 Tax=Anguilla anguilla TaxID=7936 RepID=A0A0E9W277_ANGAN
MHLIPPTHQSCISSENVTIFCTNTFIRVICVNKEESRGPSCNFWSVLLSPDFPYHSLFYSTLKASSMHFEN